MSQWSLTHLPTLSLWGHKRREPCTVRNAAKKPQTTPCSVPIVGQLAQHEATKKTGFGRMAGSLDIISGSLSLMVIAIVAVASDPFRHEPFEVDPSHSGNYRGSTGSPRAIVITGVGGHRHLRLTTESRDRHAFLLRLEGEFWDGERNPT